MNRRATLSPLAAAAIAVAGATSVQAQEATPWQMPSPSPTLTRASVMAELNEWRQAGAYHAGNEAGASERALERRVAMNQLAQERHARALEREQQRLASLEQQRLAAESASRAGSQDVVAEAPPGSGPVAPNAPTMQPTAVEPAHTSPLPDQTPAPPQPAPTAAPDALTDSNRERQTRDVLQPMPMAPGRDDTVGADSGPDVPMESEPLPQETAPMEEPLESPSDAAPSGAAQASAATVEQPDATRSDATPAPSDATAARAPNAYGYQEPANRYPSAPQGADDAETQADTDAGPAEAQAHPVR